MPPRTSGRGPLSRWSTHAPSASPPRKLADDRAAFLKKRAESINQINAVKGVISSGGLTGMTNALAAANAQAAASPPNYPAAIAALAGVDAAARNLVKYFVDIVNANLTAIAAQPAPARAFQATQIAKAQQLLADVTTASAAADWSRALMSARYALRIGPPTERMVTRRAGYDAARPAALAAIAALKAAPAVQDRAAALDALLVQADALAGDKMMRFEDGAALLAEIVARSKQSLDAAASVAGYRTERPLADAELGALDKHAAAAKVSAQRESARKLLAQAAGSATVAAGNDAGAAGHGPRRSNRCGRARRPRRGQEDRRRAGRGSRGRGRGPPAKPADVAAMKAALKAMQTDATAAGAAPFAAERPRS